MSHDFNNLAGGLAGDIFVLIEELQQRVATIEVGPRDAGSKSPADENNDTPPWSLGALGEMIGEPHLVEALEDLSMVLFDITGKSMGRKSLSGDNIATIGQQERRLTQMLQCLGIILGIEPEEDDGGLIQQSPNLGNPNLRRIIPDAFSKLDKHGRLAPLGHASTQIYQLYRTIESARDYLRTQSEHQDMGLNHLNLLGGTCTIGELFEYADTCGIGVPELDEEILELQLEGNLFVHMTWLNNLLANSIEHGGPNILPNLEIERNTDSDQSRVSFSYSDSGEGIAADMIEEVALFDASEEDWIGTNARMFAHNASSRDSGGGRGMAFFYESCTQLLRGLDSQSHEEAITVTSTRIGAHFSWNVPRVIQNTEA